MARTITLLVLVVLGAAAFAAPVKEDTVDINQLFEQADMKENDIFEPITEPINFGSSNKGLDVVSSTVPIKEDNYDTALEVKENESVMTNIETDDSALLDVVSSVPLKAEKDNIIDEIIEENKTVPEIENTENIEVTPIEIIQNMQSEVNETPKDEVANIINSDNVLDSDYDTIITDKTMDEEFIPEYDFLNPEAPIPVNEVIPEPEIAHVLGIETEQVIPDENETVEENINNYKAVEGEDELGNPIISEYQPDSNVPVDEANIEEPIIESISYEFPPDNIIPEAVFRLEQILENRDELPIYGDIAYGSYVPNTNSNENTDTIADFSSYTLSEALLRDMDRLEHGINTDDFNAMNSDFHHFNGDVMHPMNDQIYSMMPNYPDESPFDDNVDYNDNFHSTPFDDFMIDDGHMVPADMLHDQIPFDGPNYPIDFIPQENHGMIPPHIDAIVAGLNENYHPEPMPGLTLKPSEVLENLEVNYPMYDDMIVPASMMHSDLPATEEFHFEDNFVNNPMPEIPPMIEFPRPVAEILLNQPPVRGMQPMINNERPDNGIDSQVLDEIENEIIDYSSGSTTALGSIVEDDPSTVVIKFDINNREALVNGRVFNIDRPATFLNFIEHIIKSATMSPKRTFSNDHPYDMYYPVPTYNEFNNNRLHPRDMIMRDIPEYFDYQPSYQHSSYMEDSSYNPYFRSSYNSDYYPYNPFLNMNKNRMMKRYNRMRSMDEGYGYDPLPHYDGRFDYYSYY